MRENLIIIPSFPTNSIILNGLQSFLSDYFTVFFIDLPGFKKTVPLLSQISLKKYAQYTESEIKKLKLKNYYLLGISFGFGIIGEMDLGRQCRGVVALTPYIGKQGMKVTKPRRILSNIFYNFRIFRKLGIALWKSRYVTLLNKYVLRYPSNTFSIMQKEVNPEVFIDGAYYILNTETKIKIHDLPHVVLISKKDNTIMYDKVMQYFKANCKIYKEIEYNLSHFPENMSHSYFAKNLGIETVKKAAKFLTSSQALES